MFGLASHSYKVGIRSVVKIQDPITLPNLQVWYNADLANTTNFNTAPVDGGAISQWKDRSGFGNNLNKGGNNTVKPKWTANQAGVGNTYGVIRFDGVDENLDINPISWMQSRTGFTLFVVAKATTVGITTQTICTTNTSGFQITHNGSNWRVEAGGCSGVSTVTGSLDKSRFNIYALIYDGSGSNNSSKLKFRYNKNPQTLTYTGVAATTTSPSASTFYVGVGNLGNSNYFKGDIAEIIMFTRTLNSSEIGGVESYLTSHWNL